MTRDALPATLPLRFRHARRVLAGTMLIMGACGIIYEYALGVLGNNLMGSSHEQIFVVIGLMMFAMGVGSALQKHVTGRLLDKFLLLEIALGVVGGLSAIVIYAAFAYTASYRLILYAFALAIGVLIGLEIPLLIRINREYAASLRANLSDILCMDYVGAMAGALLFTYVLLTRLSVDRIAMVLGLVNCLIGLVGLAYFRTLVKRPRALALAGFGALAVLGLALARSGPWMTTLEQRSYADPIILSKTSPYQHLVLTKRGQKVNLYLNGRLQFSSRDERIYHEMLVHVPMAAAHRRARVLILGGGDGLALREVLRYPAVRAVTLVDIDPLMTRLAATHPELIRLNEGALHDGRVRLLAPGGITPGSPREVYGPPRRESPGSRVRRPESSDAPLEMREARHQPAATVHVVNVDADLFVRSIRTRAASLDSGLYDVALLDFPDPSALELAKLYSVDFYRALAGRLAPGAVMAVQSSSPYHAREAFLSIGKTLRAAGYRTVPYHQNVPSFGEWGWHLAWRGGVNPRAMRAKLTGIAALDVPTEYLTGPLLGAALVFAKGWLDDDGIEPSTKMRPAILRYYRRAWEGN